MGNNSPQPPLLSRAQSQEVDRLAAEHLGLPGLVLMENAGLISAQVLGPVLLSSGRRPVILCGAGNNGGDGYALARQLLVAGLDPLVIAWRPEAAHSQDARVQRLACASLGIEIIECLGPDELTGALSALQSEFHLVDSLLGTGVAGTLRGAAALWLQRAEDLRRDWACPCWAIDLPSGMDADLGSGAMLRSERTLTLAAVKTGLTAPCAQEYCGVVQVVPIGLPASLLRQAARSN